MGVCGVSLWPLPPLACVVMAPHTAVHRGTYLVAVVVVVVQVTLQLVAVTVGCAYLRRLHVVCTGMDTLCARTWGTCHSRGMTCSQLEQTCTCSAGFVQFTGQ